MSIQVPSKGEGLKASWAASVANGINALTPMSPSGMLVRDGAGGVGCESLPKNQRDRRAAASELPWTFVCTVTNPGTANEQRTGGWKNCRLQIGFDASIDEGNGSKYFGQEDALNVDGLYYVEVNLANDTWELKVVEKTGSEMPTTIPAHDFANNKVNVYIGTVEGGVCTYSIHCIPVVYKYV